MQTPNGSGVPKSPRGGRSVARFVRWAAAVCSALVIVGAVTPDSASAQGLINPTGLTWYHSTTDYGQTVRYEVGWYLSDTALAPVAIVDVGRPDATVCVPVDGTVTCAIPLPARPALGGWVIRVRAVGTAYGGGEQPSGWSAASNPFTASLSAPSPVSVTP